MLKNLTDRDPRRDIILAEAADMRKKKQHQSQDHKIGLAQDAVHVHQSGLARATVDTHETTTLGALSVSYNVLRHAQQQLMTLSTGSMME